MSTLLLSVLLFAVLLELVAASSPIMDYAMSTGPLDTPYPETDMFESFFCDFCSLPLYHCVHAIMAPVPHEPLHMPLLDQHQTHEGLGPVVEYNRQTQMQPQLDTEHIVHRNENGTTVNSMTVLEHVRDTYTPGDRLKLRRPRSRGEAAHKREAPRPGGGFNCSAEGCNKAFDRKCDLNRHQKTHMDRSERPHRCPTCAQGFLYPKDLLRHQHKHDDDRSPQITFRCLHPRCSHLAGFSRKDNFMRHQRRQHSATIASP